MPLTHTRDFRVRHYECDAYGHVNNANYLRYMQEAAIDASAAAGYGPAQYAALGTNWIMRATDIEYLNPLKHGETARVKTWVEDFRRVRSRRAYELTNAATGAVAARASTDWVYVNTASGQPASIPPELMAAFFPEGAPGPAPARPRHPEAPAPPPGVFRMARQVHWQDIDSMGHVNNAQYLSYVTDCGFEVARAHGWPAGRIQADGIAILVRLYHIEYRQPAVLDDELVVSTWLYDVRRVTCWRAFDITRAADGALLTQVRALYTWVSLETGRPIRIPEAVMVDFADNVAGTGTEDRGG
jgi:acyl-CoA thioester hydrolase